MAAFTRFVVPIFHKCLMLLFTQNVMCFCSMREDERKSVGSNLIELCARTSVPGLLRLTIAIP